MRLPVISVCIPAYNASQCFLPTLKSAQRQSYPNINIVICIDPSSDDTVALCQSEAEKDRRISVHQNDQRLGWGGNVQATMLQARADWLSVLPQDDLWHPKYLENLWQAREATGTDFSYSDLQAFSGEQAFGTQCSPDFSSDKAHSRLHSYYRSVAIPNMWHGLFPTWLTREIPFPAEPYNYPALDNLWTNKVLCRYRGTRVEKAMYFKRMSDKELQTCSWWWNNEASSSDRVANAEQVKEQMLVDAHAVLGKDEALDEWLHLAMDIRLWSPNLLSGQTEEAASLYQHWRPDTDQQTGRKMSLRWLMASRCSQALGNTDRAMQEAELAAASPNADWRAWQNLAQQHARKGDLFLAQEVLLKAREQFPNQFQLGKLHHTLFSTLMLKRFESSAP